MESTFSIDATFSEYLGFEIIEWQEGYVKIVGDLQPQFLNRHGIPHGGYMATLIDNAIGFSGLFCPDKERHRLALTLSLNINYVGKAKTNSLYAIGRVTKSGYKVFFSEAHIYDSEDNLLATAQGVMRYNKGSETLEGIPKEPLSST